MWADIGSIATAVGVLLVVLQLGFARAQQRTALEDAFAREYRAIADALPAEAFFDKPDPERALPDFHTILDKYVRYIDLSNQQVFLRSQRRVSSKTWTHWADGIDANLGRPGFKQAWQYVRIHSPRSYDELASFYVHPDRDPAWWAVVWWRAPFKTLRDRGDQPEPWTPPASEATAPDRGFSSSRS